jgi:peptide/nickel transport system permease protein
MLHYALRRLALGALVVISVSVLAFVLVRLSGDVATMLAGEDATAADVEALRAALDLDRPLHEQYLAWAGGALQGSFGQSLAFPMPVFDLIAARAPTTIVLALSALAVSLVLGLSLGVAGAMNPGGWIDRGVQAVAALGQAAPTFFLALLLIVLLGVQLRVLPIAGSGGPENFVMPVAVLAIHLMPSSLRLVRSGMLGVMQADYIRTARAKGLHPATVVMKHGLRNALLPVVSLAAVQLGALLEGAIVVETVFALNGLGLLTWESVNSLDFMVIQALVFWGALVYVALTLAADLANAWLDPRLRTARR